MRHIARIAYTVFAWLFVIGVAVQVFLVGMVVVAAEMGWDAHVGLGHALGFPLLLMLVSMYLGGLGKKVKRLTWLLFVFYVFQADILIFLRGSLPFAAALHPVIALIEFSFGWQLASRSRKYWPTSSEEEHSTSALAEPASG